jgi:hypothetical protein
MPSFSATTSIEVVGVTDATYRVSDAILIRLFYGTDVDSLNVVLMVEYI